MGMGVGVRVGMAVGVRVWEKQVWECESEMASGICKACMVMSEQASKQTTESRASIYKHIRRCVITQTQIHDHASTSG
jgi:hypothetical protein